MPELRTIEIDFDIHKLIEGERRSFSESPNSALRRLLKLPEIARPEPHKQPNANGRSWSGEGVIIPHGTAARMRYNGRLFEGRIVDGKWVIEGKSFDSPSGAASGIAITKKGRKTRLDGWIYWEVQLNGSWTSISALRRKTSGELTLADLTGN
jgi:hypothetical protein